MSLARTKEESAWAQWGKKLNREKIVSTLSACDVTRVVSLGTNNQAQVFGDNGEFWEIYNLLLLFLVNLSLIKWFLFS
jgi:hypothetical protein